MVKVTVEMDGKIQVFEGKLALVGVLDEGTVETSIAGMASADGMSEIVARIMVSCKKAIKENLEGQA